MRAGAWRAAVATTAAAAVAGLSACAAVPAGHAQSAPARAQLVGAAVAQPAAVTAGSHVWVSVAVATLWTSATAPRSIDAPALAAPVHIRKWLAAMSTAARRGLMGRVETQALYGEPLTVIGTSGTWLHVVSPTQPTHRDRRGYPGWVPRRQVTTHPPASKSTVATVIKPTTWLRNTSGTRVLEISFGSRLPVLSASASTAKVATPTGATLVVARADVAVRSATAAALTATRSSIVTVAKRFLGLPYLWGGRSGFAVDCSGFTNLVYAVHGIRLPRDTDDQARAGTAVGSRALRAGDLAYYGAGTTPSHVAMYVNGTTLIHAPAAGQPVRLVAASNMAKPVTVRRWL